MTHGTALAFALTMSLGSSLAPAQELSGPCPVGKKVADRQKRTLCTTTISADAQSSLRHPMPSTPRQFASVEESLSAMRAASPAQGELTREMTQTELAHYTAELERRLATYAQPDGRIVLAGEALLGVGTR